MLETRRPRGRSQRRNRDIWNEEVETLLLEILTPEKNHDVEEEKKLWGGGCEISTLSVYLNVRRRKSLF